MSRPGIFVRIHARLHGDERGFGLIETVIAITVMFGSLVSLAYTATIGLGYAGFARDRQAAAGIANQVMEEARGLAYSKITAGLSSTDLSGDSNIVNCAGTYKFQSCSGDNIISSSGLATTPPLVPHTGTVSTGYPAAFTWSVYVTNNTPATSPYTITVIASWSATKFTGLAHSVTVQSFFWSPTGCVSSSTHPYAAPCQPFFYGQARAPQPRIDVSGTVANMSFSSDSLFGTGAEADGQQEQVTQVQAYATTTGTSLTDGGGTQTGGGTTTQNAAADADPASAVTTYSNTNPIPAGAASSFTSSGGGNSITVANAASDTGSITSAVSAGGANVCPVPPAAAETDNAPCGFGKVQQAGTASSTLTLNHGGANEGTATLASIGAAGSATTTFVNRTLVSGQDGYLEQTTVRSLGTVSLFGLPSNVTGPAGWTGYLMTLSSYGDTTTASGGTSAAAPTASVTAGTLSYWNGAGYSTLNAAALATSQSINFTAVNRTVTISGHSVNVQISGTASTGGVATSSTPSGGGSITRTQTSATAGAPITATITYAVTVDGASAANLTVTVNLGQIDANAKYAAAPTAG